MTTTTTRTDTTGRSGTDASRSSRVPALFVAGITACVSGVAVFVNAYAVHSVRQPAVYTTAKNVVAAMVLVTGSALVTWRRRRSGGERPSGTIAAPITLVTPATPAAPATPSLAARLGRWAALAYVGVVGGGVAFILFFVGLAKTTAEPAAFLHDTLVVWVALLAVAFIRERSSMWNLAAIVLLVGGQTAVVGGIGHLVVGEGQLLVLMATLLWAVETVLAKWLLASVAPARLGRLRMAVGAVVLVGYLGVRGQLGDLVSLHGSQLGWVLLTGGLLSAYVATWMVALARARAVDVTSVLVGSVLVTALCQAAAGKATTVLEGVGLALVGVGVLAAARALPRPAPAPWPAPSTAP